MAARRVTDRETERERDVGGYDVLVVDDDASIRDTIRQVLEFGGYSVKTANNGQEALDRLDQGLPQLLLMDMRMPVLDGWGVARELTARQWPVKVLVMTAARDAHAWAEEIHADGYLAKPFEVRELLGAVGRWCSSGEPMGDP